MDAVGTLIHPTPRFSQVYVTVAQAHGFELDEALVLDRFPIAFRRVVWQDADEARHRENWQQIVAEVTGCGSSQSGPVFDQLWHHFGQPSAWSVYPDVPSALDSLEAHDVQLAIGSNFDRRLVRICQGHPALRRIQHVFWSAGLAASKPQRAFFEQVATCLHADTTAICMVGDDVRNDYQGARQAGWQACWLDRAQQNDGGVSERITSLSQLLPALRFC